jgi:FtsP/CotA-like multicopper oxidase with cupredoxin domain
MAVDRNTRLVGVPEAGTQPAGPRPGRDRGWRPDHRAAQSLDPADGATEQVNLRVGERVLVRFIGSSAAFIHPMQIHGGPFTIAETDGYPMPEGARLIEDTVNVGPGERYDVIWEARVPGKWLLHWHITHHTINDNHEEQGGGGLMLILNVT